MTPLQRCIPLCVCMASIGAAAGAPRISSQARPMPAKPALNAAQILDRFVEATGGRDAYMRRTSTITSVAIHGWSEPHAPGKPERDHEAQATEEIYAKAPDRRLTVSKMPDNKNLREGYDGKVAWIQSEMKDAREMAREVMPKRRREAAFNAPLRWRELYEKVELIGVRKVDQRDTYAIRLTPPLEKPMVHYYDTRTFLLLRIETTEATPVGAVPSETSLSDYRVVDGVKIPFVSRQRMRFPEGIAHIHVTITRVQTNVPIDDALFAGPAAASPQE